MQEGFKTMFDSVFNNARPDEIGCFLRNEMVPFEYCEMALKMKNIGWKNKLIIAKRSDCPIDVMSRICRNGGEKLLDALFTIMSVIPERVVREIYEKKNNCSHLISYWRLPDDIKSKMFQSFLIRDGHGRIINYKHQMDDFLRYQVYLPDDCRDFMDDIMEVRQAKHSNWISERIFNEQVRPMRTPLDDDYALSIIDHMNGRSIGLILKLAANPSISDYAMMEIRVKCPVHAIDDVNEILAKREPARDEYRRMHA